MIESPQARDARRRASQVAASLAGLLTVAVASPALACRTGPIDPARLTLEAQPLVFVGEVTAVSRAKTTFRIESVVRGVPTGTPTIVVDNNPPSTCTHVFKVGQRWLYAGDFTGGPTRLLNEAPAGQP